VNNPQRHPTEWRSIVMAPVVSNSEIVGDWETLAIMKLAIMRSTGTKCLATRTATYACLMMAGMNISDQPFRNGSLFQTAAAQQVRQVRQVQQVQQTQQPQRPRQITVTRPTAATPVESGSPTASCDQQFSRADLVLPGPKGPIKLDSCYRGREHFICSVNAIIGESQKLRSEYEKIVQMNSPSFKTLEPVCRLSTESVATDIKLVADFFPRFRAIKSAFDRQANCAVNIGRTIKELNLSTMTNGAEIVRSMMEAIDGDMRNVPDERQNSSDLSETIESARKSLDAIEKLHAAMCPAPNNKNADLR
jgi:hypothetical protein